MLSYLLLLPSLPFRPGRCLMRREQLEEMRELEDEYWWFVGRRRMVRDLVRRHMSGRDSLRILDAGCGTGGTLAALEGVGELWGCDIAAEALDMCRTRGFEDLVQGSVEALDFDDASFDVVISCDVLEHVEDDAAAMAELARVLRPGGICVLTLPAYRWLWSEHDEVLGHLRRYVGGEVRTLVKGAGLVVEKLTGAVTFALPMIVLYRVLTRLSRRKPEGEARTSLVQLPGFINRTLIWLVDLENLLTRRLRLPWGASVVAVARKPDA